MEDDSQLWDLYRGGDRSAFERIYTLFYQSLYEYGRRKGYDLELIRDTIQDLFIKLWLNRQTTGSTTHIKYYLLASFKNLMINTITKKTYLTYVALPPDDTFQIEFNVEPDFIRQEHVAYQSEQLTKALNQLSPRQKEIIYLRYFEDMDFAQIALLLNITLKGAYKLNSRAFDALKEALNLPGSIILLLLFQLELASLT